jgi:hypothetical protein
VVFYVLSQEDEPQAKSDWLKEHNPAFILLNFHLAKRAAE